jgi:hypothetical protein
MGTKGMTFMWVSNGVHMGGLQFADDETLVSKKSAPYFRMVFAGMTLPMIIRKCEQMKWEYGFIHNG